MRETLKATGILERAIVAFESATGLHAETQAEPWNPDRILRQGNVAAGLVVLKLIAWRDRHLETTKDATDFLLIARHYADVGNFDRLYETEADLLQAVDFDPELAGAMPIHSFRTQSRT